MCMCDKAGEQVKKKKRETWREASHVCVCAFPASFVVWPDKCGLAQNRLFNLAAILLFGAVYGSSLYLSLMAVIRVAAGLTTQHGNHGNTDRGLSVAMATADALWGGSLWLGDEVELVESEQTAEAGGSHTLAKKVDKHWKLSFKVVCVVYF